MSLYFFLNIASFIIPFLYSFENRMKYIKRWKAVFSAIIITAIFFIIWDIIFTKIGVWRFNPRYHSGVEFFDLPIEEWLFFICIPYACIFLYEALKHLIRRDLLVSVARPITIILIVFLVSFGLMSLPRWYTSITFLSTAFFLALLEWRWKVLFLGRFYLTFLFVLIPFFLVNGILTGSFIEEPVVWYNADEILGLRIGTIPFEDTFYGMLLLLMNIYFFDRSHARSN